MGCMHAFVWGETHPGFAEKLAPFACNARSEIAGRNRMWRKMSIDAIKADPAWNDAETIPTQPELRHAHRIPISAIIAGGNPVGLQAL